MLNLGNATAIAAALVVAAMAGTGGWMARGMVVDTIEIPRVITQQAEMCAAETATVAARATRDEQLRQFKIADRAAEQFDQRSQAAADDRQAEREVLEMEIEHYAQRVRESGRVCALDADDLALLGLRRKPDSPAPGGR